MRYPRAPAIFTQGGRNWSKGKVLLWLYHTRYKLGHRRGLDIYALSAQTGVPRGHIEDKIIYWWRWGLLLREKRDGHFYYTIAGKLGLDYLRRAPQWAIDGMWNEIQAHQAAQAARRAAYLEQWQTESGTDNSTAQERQ